MKSQASLRHTNLALALRAVCAAEGPLSRADVAQRIGSTRATAAAHVDALVAAGLLDEPERSAAVRPGRPGQPLAPGRGIAALGMQVDVTGIDVRVIDLTGEVIGQAAEPGQLRGSDPTRTLTRLGQVSRKVLRSLHPSVRVVGAALAVPGISTADRILYAPNLGWTDVRPRQLLGRGGLPVRLGNEADFAARTVMEPVPGRFADLGDFLYVAGDVGVGGAIVRDGVIRGGSRGWTGEIGHICVDPRGPECSCGATGCLEQYAGRDALLRAAGLSAGAAVADAIGSSRAAAAVEQAVGALGIALATALNVLDMPTVVLAGHLGLLAEARPEQLRDCLRTRVLVARWAEPVVIPLQPLVGRGATGAALACLNEVLDDPPAFFPDL